MEDCLWALTSSPVPRVFESPSMKKVIILAVLAWGSAYAQQPYFVQNDNVIKEIEAQTEKFRYLSEHSRQETERIQQHTQQMQKETERLVQESERRRLETDSFFEDLAKSRAKQEAEKAAKEAAEETARQNAYQSAVASAQSRNHMLYLFFFLAAAALTGFVLNKRKGGQSMTTQEKSGVLIMTLATVLPFISLLSRRICSQVGRGPGSEFFVIRR